MITLPQKRQDNISSALEAIPKKAARVTKQKWLSLIGMLQISVPLITGESGMFIIIKHVLIVAEGQFIILTVPAHEKLNLWRKFIASFARRPTYLGEIYPNPPMCKGATVK